MFPPFLASIFSRGLLTETVDLLRGGVFGMDTQRRGLTALQTRVFGAKRMVRVLQ